MADSKSGVDIHEIESLQTRRVVGDVTLFKGKDAVLLPTPSADPNGNTNPGLRPIVLIVC
jgi:hypothetical protein